MSYRTDKQHQRRIKKVAYDTAVDKKIISDIIDLGYEFIKSKVEKNVISEDVELTEEEFNKLLPIIKVPTIGYFKPNYYRYKKIQEYKKRKNNE